MENREYDDILAYQDMGDIARKAAAIVGCLKNPTETWAIEGLARLAINQVMSRYRLRLSPSALNSLPDTAKDMLSKTLEEAAKPRV